MLAAHTRHKELTRLTLLPSTANDARRIQWFQARSTRQQNHVIPLTGNSHLTTRPWGGEQRTHLGISSPFTSKGKGIKRRGSMELAGTISCIKQYKVSY